ncbi:bifunctional folylpolyglutamate synthase/dihydrofolate synthase [Bacillus sp. FJAT-42315]|uniref:bifunctional folylpolyglutamate synthase/dihydrofolate synthase n=1 Tax=Bacillus sp. FJAT-42315 TaxID=2014077 RepID=UPI000C241DCB|nr:folylpolyglutamate synthase/dihydrofolate synthase family protein [Bacillus sp. FJAT-42315]
MIHTHQEALNWIHSRLQMGIKPGLLRMEWLMERMNHPERRLKTIHIGGTNGKGSTVTYMRSILQAAGYEIGTFTSPYIEQFNERISVNGIPITDDELTQLVNVIKPLAEELEQTELGGPSEFEVITAMAFYYFADVHPVDIVLFEVGLGGRLDSTNVIQPLLSIITTIGMDHMQFLGNTLEEIAFEKAGIIKSGVPIISGVKQEEAKAVISKRAADQKSTVYQLGEQFQGEWQQSLSTGEAFHFHSELANMESLHTGLNGLHQTDNAALAVMATLYLKNFSSFFIEESHIREGLEAACWPGRMEQVCHQPVILLDGAHNPEGMKALSDSLQARYPDSQITALFAGLKDKKLDEMISSLTEVADTVIFTTFDFPRAAGYEEFEPLLNEQTVWRADWEECIKEFQHSRQKERIFVVTGSLYFISEVKKLF